MVYEVKVESKCQQQEVHGPNVSAQGYSKNQITQLS
jgi:hypothetical protein